jgi:hypothetical protein
MSAKSNNTVDIVQWIENVIESCTNIHQLDVADNLVYNFETITQSNNKSRIVSMLRKKIRDKELGL